MADLSGLSQDDLDAIEIAKAKAAAKEAEINAAAGVTDPVDGGALKEGVRAVGEGVMSLPDIVPHLLTASFNAGRDIAAGVPNPTGGREGAQVWFPPANKTPVHLPDVSPATDLYNASLPPDPNHPEARKVGKIAGSLAPLIVAPELAVGRVPALLPALGRTADVAFTTATTYGGGKGGRAIDEALGGSGDTGEAFGSLIGSVATPTAAIASSRLTTDANSLLRLRNAKLAGVEKPDLSLVGSNWASRRGNPANQELQQSQIDQSLRDLSAERRGSPAPGPISETQVGQGVIDLSKQGAERAAADADTAYRTGFDQIDQNAPITPEALAPFSADAEPTYQQPFIDEYQKAIDASRYKDSRTAPRLLDPNAQAGLEANVTLAQRELDRLTQARADPAKIKSAEQDLAQAKSNLDANYGTTFNDVKVRRGDVRTRLDAGEGDSFILGQIHDAQTEAMRQAAVQRGITPEEFDNVNKTYATLKDQQAALEKLAQSKEGPAYSNVFGPGGEKNVSTLKTLQENADPQALGRILADNLELKARGPAAAGRPELPLDTGLNARAPDWWAKLDNQVRDAYFPPGSPQRAKMDAVMATMRADARRGGYQTEPPSLTTPAGIGAVVTGHPAAAAAIMAPRIGSAMFGRLMQNPRFTQAMVERRANPLTPLDLARTIAASVGAQQSP